MAGAFAWINSIIQSLGKLIPRLLLVRATYTCVVFRRNGSLRIRQPGMFFYWPITTEVRMIPTTVRTTGVRGVAVATATNAMGLPLSTCVGCSLIYQATDIEKFIGAYDAHSIIAEVLTQALVSSWDGADDDGYDEACQNTIATELERYGISVVSFGVVDVYRRLTIGGTPEFFPRGSAPGDRDNLSDG